MQSARSTARTHRSPSQILGVALLLLMYMAQPVLAAQSAFCGCAGMASGEACMPMDGANGSTVGESSCCAKPADRAVKKSCCASGEVPDAESVCHCPPHPVESVPNGVVLEAVAFTGPFVWWAELQAHANEVQLLAPHLGGLDAEYAGVWSLDLTLGHGLLKPNRGPTGPAAAKLCRGGLIAFLADLSVANL